ncbi:MAG: hypothetical protein A3A96_02415 [Candidatus Zambryskibacteria bacterium RIFCSPLOWO2_01_FULL_39_39]|uniref:DUF11 domain-containing protein n=1 Tax=Candidatus Zambryskibacteria bacterium RIFCSPLOWO2_01_FULL_39_39 TaxID=1802758 RepID=A0A1G2TZE9_9BACT|nr:MAG: hypothetical protein UT00_C0010G0030 [Parcubacteria group bacterium GW2011_GWA1_38_7]OHA87167.1 MAG: hypothetical protein A2644_02130 [Candidatus Zambryskibacteria bacterium RIFCSPHIGHO2_01_FULL_39_63]OHA94805.1 MAG: hypothetical protein A3B88_04175 [Candidatus Zambryskibacteria bacterium RIFCSPHIGHO2_02_FULL_39_19]OHA98295.1 MAG: hypothetical protein A3F20_01865 [Candidatus Zambryskibacteria bacterium RIFCSPHIGHO2_12_FULL_39_21]OHB02681.1 MAG: hypothetical protein A3A96_02415 [Candidat
MYFHSLNFNRYKITKVAFSVFLVIGILNWAFMPGLLTYAEEEVPAIEIAVVETPSAPEVVVPSEVVIETGDAVSQSEIQNDANTQEITTEAQNSGQIAPQSSENNEVSTSVLNIEGQNEAEVQNTATTTAETGSNNAEGVATTTITTGDAVGNVDVVNLVNTNIVDSSGSIIAGGASLGGSSLDLRANFASTTASTTCPLCLSDISIENQNNATVTNNIIVSAETGDNNASSTGAGIIRTGDAFAGANVVNIINSNIVKSNYMLLVFNNFGDWSGDLVFPNSDFFANLFSNFSSGCITCSGDTYLSNSNNANVSNTVNTSAESGDNTASGEGTSINSGEALASSNVYNQVNTNVYNSASFYLLIKVFGDWGGNIFNLPEGIVWRETPKGIVLYNEADGNPLESEMQPLVGGGETSIQNTNSADVVNNINVSATTGNNNALGDDVSIQTGNAYAGSNQVNIVNTNVVSSNWTRVLVNIFGNWQGNISFGEPDLWIGTVAESSGTLVPGSSVKFTTTIKNNGDATASGIKVLAEPEFPYLDIDGNNEWILSPLLAGESTEISYSGSISRSMPLGAIPIQNTVSVSSFETDGNMEDNTDVIDLVAYNYSGPRVRPSHVSRTSTYPNLEVTKTHTLKSAVGINGVEMVPFLGSADYKIVVKNNGGLAYEGLLVDQLKNEAGEIINEQTWDLGKIFANEEIVITYTTEFTASTTPGTYTNYAWVEALGGDYSYNPKLASKTISNMASSTVVVAEKPIVLIVEEQVKALGEVLGLLIEDVSAVGEEQYVEFLGGFCREESGDKMKTLSVSQSILLGLSFILIVRKKKYIPTNLFMI